MPTRQQMRALAHQQRKQRREPLALPAAEAIAPVVEQISVSRRLADAVDAWQADMAAEFRIRQDTIDEGWADFLRIRAAADAKYDEAKARHDAALDKRIADSHQAEANEPDEANGTDGTHRRSVI